MKLIGLPFEVVSLIFFLFRFELGWVQKGFNSNEEYLIENLIPQLYAPTVASLYNRCSEYELPTIHIISVHGITNYT